jgi:predicted amidohydrolase YtcJ
MMKRGMLSLAVGVVWLWAGSAAAQRATETLYLNANILTVDDEGFTPNLGTIAQAMLVTNDRIVALGSEAAVRRRASSGARVIDLKGRTVLPGLVSVHEHPFDWTPVNPSIVTRLLTDDLVITRVIEGSPEEQLAAYPSALKEAVAKARPGQWIYFVFPFGKNYEHSSGGNGGFGQGTVSLFGQTGARTGPLITKAHLDAIAPNNPVLFRDT